jgi:hypothetical protein
MCCLICVVQSLRIKKTTAPTPASDEGLREGIKRLREDTAHAHYIDQSAAEVPDAVLRRRIRRHLP